MLSTSFNYDKFYEWAIEIRGTAFYYNSLLDMIDQPCWHPNFAAASQLKDEFLSRIYQSAKIYEKHIKNTEITDLIQNIETECFSALSKSYNLFLPGPLEGFQGNGFIMPEIVTEEIIKQLQKEEVEFSSFAAIVNSAYIYKIEQNQGGLASSTLKRCNYRLANLKNKNQLLAIFNGLASVAAVSRCKDLANDIRILVRKYWNDAYFELSVEDVLNTCITAAACNVNLTDWREFLGEWITELAFSDLKGEDVIKLQAYLDLLCQINPELWLTLGRADAAIKAYNRR